jgi:hypothetical protein
MSCVADVSEKCWEVCKLFPKILLVSPDDERTWDEAVAAYFKAPGLLD